MPERNKYRLCGVYSEPSAFLVSVNVLALPLTSYFFWAKNIVWTSRFGKSLISGSTTWFEVFVCPISVLSRVGRTFTFHQFLLFINGCIKWKTIVNVFFCFLDFRLVDIVGDRQIIDTFLLSGLYSFIAFYSFLFQRFAALGFNTASLKARTCVKQKTSTIATWTQTRYS